MKFGTDECLDGELDRCARCGVESTAEVDHARSVFPDRQSPARPQFVFARFHAVGIEVRLELLDQAREAVDAHDRCTVDEQLFGRLDGVSVGTHRDAIEEPTDRLGGVDTDRARIQ